MSPSQSLSCSLVLSVKQKLMHVVVLPASICLTLLAQHFNRTQTIGGKATQNNSK